MDHSPFPSAAYAHAWAHLLDLRIDLDPMMRTRHLSPSGPCPSDGSVFVRPHFRHVIRRTFVQLDEIAEARGPVQRRERIVALLDYLAGGGLPLLSAPEHPYFRAMVLRKALVQWRRDQTPTDVYPRVCEAVSQLVRAVVAARLDQPDCLWLASVAEARRMWVLPPEILEQHILPFLVVSAETEIHYRVLSLSWSRKRVSKPDDKFRPVRGSGPSGEETADAEPDTVVEPAGRC